jgi:hypothetical protein
LEIIWWCAQNSSYWLTRTDCVFKNVVSQLLLLCLEPQIQPFWMNLHWRAKDVIQVVEHLPSKLKALNSNPNIANK